MRAFLAEQGCAVGVLCLRRLCAIKSLGGLTAACMQVALEKADGEVPIKHVIWFMGRLYRMGGRAVGVDDPPPPVWQERIVYTALWCEPACECATVLTEYRIEFYAKDAEEEARAEALCQEERASVLLEGADAPG